MKLPSSESVTAAGRLLCRVFQPFEQPADDLDMETCTCGARLPENAGWCPVCLKVPVDRDALLDELHDTFRKTTWTPPERLTRPAPPKAFTRWRATLFTFGPRVKIPLTVAVGAVMLQSIWITQPWSLFKHSGFETAKPFLVFQLVLTTVCGGLFLRALWRKAREQ
jgi:hypothetical protein